MKRAMAVLVPVLLLLTGCAAPSVDDAYVSVVREGVPALADAGAAELTKLGHQVCDILEDRGFEAGLTEFIRIAKETGITAAEAGHVAGAASVAYCDEYADEF
jgi:hypothetical protein